MNVLQWMVEEMAKKVSATNELLDKEKIKNKKATKKVIKDLDCKGVYTMPEDGSNAGLYCAMWGTKEIYRGPNLNEAIKIRKIYDKENKRARKEFHYGTESEAGKIHCNARQKFDEAA
jgi:hypothetical protein